MLSYKEFVGRLMDQECTMLEIARAILRAQSSGTVKVPIKGWAAADRMVKMVEGAPAQRLAMEQVVSDIPPQSLLYDSRVTVYLRQCLQDPAYSIKLQEKLPKWKASLMKKFALARHLFGERKAHYLAELGILTFSGKWSEEKFQKFVRLANLAYRRQLKPCFEHLRLWMHDCADMSGKLKTKDIRFDWLLCDDKLSMLERQAARRIAEFLLRGTGAQTAKIGRSITASQVKQLKRILAWIAPTGLRNEPLYLEQIAFLAKDYPALNWPRLGEIIAFIDANRRKKPDPELLRDYCDGYVDIAGKGKFQG